MVTVALNVPVICYGLRADFFLQGFPGSTRLLELAHNIEEMKTICQCGRKAMFNGRKVNGKFVFEGAQVAIDMENNVQYESLCPQCYFRERDKFFFAEKGGGGGTGTRRRRAVMRIFSADSNQKARSGTGVRPFPERALILFYARRKDGSCQPPAANFFIPP